MKKQNVVILAATCAVALIGLTGCGAAQPPARNETATGKLPDPQAGSAIPAELEYVPDGYTTPAEHQGTLEKLEYRTWESLSYGRHTRPLVKTAWAYLPCGV